MSTNHIRTSKIIESFEAKALKRRRWAFKIADNLTAFFGSVTFLVMNIVFITLMLLMNTGSIPGITIFDPYPFVFLATILALEIVLVTIIIVMSQIRQNQTMTLRNELQLQVGLITEKELTKVLKLMRLILRKQGVEIKNDAELEEMVDEIDASYIERKLEQEILPEKPNIVEQLSGKTPLTD